MSRRVTKLLFNVRRSYTAQDVKTKTLAIADSSRVSIPVTKNWVKGVGVADLLTTSSTTPLPHCVTVPNLVVLGHILRAYVWKSARKMGPHLSKSLKVIGTESATYDFLLVIHGSHRPVVHRLRDYRRFR